jgi:hypothetical protein
VNRPVRPTVYVEMTRIWKGIDPPMAFTNCTPNEPWQTATTEGVQSLDGSFSERTIPLEHRDWGTYTIQKSGYPQGLVLIPTGSDPTAIPSVPLRRR